MSGINAPGSRIRFFNPSRRGRDFVVGDLHGCRSMFDRMLEEIGFDKRIDRMFCTGDLGDRGPESRECIALLDEPWFFSVMGNHEMALIESVSNPHFNWDWWLANGGAWARGCMAEELVEYADKVSDLPLAIVVGDGEERFNVIHAEFFGSDDDLASALADEAPESAAMSLLWGRDLIDGKRKPDEQEGLSLTFCGHSPVTQVSKLGSQVFIDTGAYMASARNDHSTYALTIIEPRTARVWRSKPVS